MLRNVQPCSFPPVEEGRNVPLPEFCLLNLAPLLKPGSRLCNEKMVFSNAETDSKKNQTPQDFICIPTASRPEKSARLDPMAKPAFY
jgi:hypothetical protein